MPLIRPQDLCHASGSQLRSRPRSDPRATHPVPPAPSSDPAECHRSGRAVCNSSGFAGPQLQSACHPSGVVGIPGMSAGCPPSRHSHRMLRSRHREHVQPLAGNADADTGRLHQGTTSPTVVCTHLSPAATSLLLCRLPSRATKTNDALSQMIRGLDLLQPSDKPTLPCVQGPPALSWDLQ